MSETVIEASQPSLARTDRDKQILWLLLAVLAALTALYLFWPMWRATFPLELSRNEPWNAWHIDAAMRGENIYPDPNALIVNNYPPLSFYLVGLVARLTGDTIYAGRLVALLSTFGLAFSIYGCARALQTSRRSAVFGVVVFLATFFLFFGGYATMNDPSMLSLAIMGGALVLFLRRLNQGKAVEPAIALMVLAGFFKHNIVVIPLAALIYLGLRHRGQAIRATLFGGALTAMGLGACIWIYGPNFIPNLMLPREMGWLHMILVAKRLQFMAPALVFGSMWAWQNRTQDAARFLLILIGLSVVSGCLQASGAGVHMNALFEAVFASSLGVALAFDRSREISLGRVFQGQRAHILIVAVVLIRLLASQRLESYLVAFSPAFRQDIAANARALDREIERIKTLPGPVSCSEMTVCYRAGKAFVYDWFAVTQRVVTHHWTEDELNRATHNAGIRFETIDPKAYAIKNRLF